MTEIFRPNLKPITNKDDNSVILIHIAVPASSPGNVGTQNSTKITYTKLSQAIQRPMNDWLIAMDMYKNFNA